MESVRRWLRATGNFFAGTRSELPHHTSSPPESTSPPKVASPLDGASRLESASPQSRRILEASPLPDYESSPGSPIVSLRTSFAPAQATAMPAENHTHNDNLPSKNRILVTLALAPSPTRFYTPASSPADLKRKYGADLPGQASVWDSASDNDNYLQRYQRRIRFQFNPTGPGFRFLHTESPDMMLTPENLSDGILHLEKVIKELDRLNGNYEEDYNKLFDKYDAKKEKIRELRDRKKALKEAWETERRAVQVYEDRCVCGVSDMAEEDTEVEEEEAENEKEVDEFLGGLAAEMEWDMGESWEKEEHGEGVEDEVIEFTMDDNEVEDEDDVSVAEIILDN